MPIIVPIEDNKVGLATATDAKFRAPDYSGSGLDALGAGLAQLGGGAQQLASGIDERRRRAAEAIAAAMLDDKHQSNIDDAAVKNAYVDYSDLTHDALNGDKGLFKQQGADAHAAFPGVVEKLVDNHDKVLASLDKVQRAAIAPTFGARLRKDVDVAAKHVREQGKAEQEWQAEKLLKATARDAVASLADPDLHDHHLATGENSLIKQGRVKNLPDKEINRQVADYKSAVHATTIEELAKTDPGQAVVWYARNVDNLNDIDKQRVDVALTPPRMEAGQPDERAVVDLGTLPDAPLEQPRELLSPAILASLKAQADLEAGRDLPAPNTPSLVAAATRRRRRNRDNAATAAGASAEGFLFTPAYSGKGDRPKPIRIPEGFSFTPVHARHAEPYTGHVVIMPNGKGLADADASYQSRFLMSPISQLQVVADIGRDAGRAFDREAVGIPTSPLALKRLYRTIKRDIATGGRFDFQRARGKDGAFIQYPQFRNVSNFNVGLYMQQMGIFSLPETLEIAGKYAWLHSSNYRPDRPYGLDDRTAKWIVIGYHAGQSGVYGKPAHVQISTPLPVPMD